MMQFTAVAYQRCSQAHRPTDGDSMAREILQLAAHGLTERDISVALRLDPGVVRKALSPTTSQSARIEQHQHEATKL